MPTEGQVYLFSPQETAGVSYENSVAESPKKFKGMLTSFSGIIHVPRCHLHTVTPHTPSSDSVQLLLSPDEWICIISPIRDYKLATIWLTK